MAQVQGSHGSGGATHSAPRSQAQQIIDAAKESANRLKNTAWFDPERVYASSFPGVDTYLYEQGYQDKSADGLHNVWTEKGADMINASGLLNEKVSAGSVSDSDSDDWTTKLYDTLYTSQKNLLKDNSAEAERLWNLQKDWQTEMANTAHQREAADLRAAGFNPVLTAIGGGMGQGASTGGSTANPSFAPMQSNDTADLVIAIGSVISDLVNNVKRFK